MAISNVKATFNADIKKVWETITSFTDYSWRSDLNKIEILNETQFVEYSADGYATKFTITNIEPLKIWEFDLENDNIKGHWMGVFSVSGEKTTVDFTENVTAKKFFMKPFVKGYLKSQQSKYISDLQKAVNS